MKHLLSIESLSAQSIAEMVDYGLEFKKNRGKEQGANALLQNQVWALVFSKSSTRTRVSFEVGIRELGGDVMYLSSRDIQLGRGEPIEDTARVLGRMIHGAVIRTFDQKEVETFAEYSHIPTINALTDLEHPCQILADLLTIREKFGTWEGKKVSFFGDANNNMGRSWIWAARHLGFELVLASPKSCQPDAALAEGIEQVSYVEDVEAAAAGADVLYTDVFVSMGQEKEEGIEEKIAALRPYQINSELVQLANPGAIVQHCLPAYRGYEITAELLEERQEEIFTQAENRLHAQKGVLRWLVEK